METIVCKCRVITPMFSSGADQTKCEIRVPEIKAAMRFWWRAAHSNLGPEELRKKETLIFGGSGDNEARKSSFTMRVENVKPIDYGQNDWKRDAIKVETGKDNPINIFDYLAYGVSIRDNVYEKKGDKYYNRITGNYEWLDPEKDRKKINKKQNLIQRNGIAPGSIFDLVVRFDQQYKDQIMEILSLFSCFGSLGAKSRNGFGKIVIDKIDEQPFHTDIVELCKKYFGKMEECPTYTAFSKKFSLFGSNYRYEKWQDALAEIGDAYRMARIGENFKDGLLGDHYSGKNRQYIALPLMIDGKLMKENDVGLDRMAKQFFMIVEPEKDEEGEWFRGYILHLPFDLKKLKPGIDDKKWAAANEEMKLRLEKMKSKDEEDEEDEEIFTVEIRGEVIK